MGLFQKVVSVRPNQIGYLYQDNKFQKRLNPGIYKYFNVFNKFDEVIAYYLRHNQEICAESRWLQIFIVRCYENLQKKVYKYPVKQSTMLPVGAASGRSHDHLKLVGFVLDPTFRR